MSKVIIINGPGGVGKDTLVMFCRQYLTRRGIPSINISTVDIVKQAFRILGWDGVTKGEAERKFLSDLKDMSTAYNDRPSNYIAEEVKSNPGSITFAHCREPEEIDKLVKLLRRCGHSVITLHVDRDVQKFSNHADSNTRNYIYDIYIHNIGTLENLEQSAETFINNLLKK